MPRMYSNLRRGLLPLMDENIYTVINVRPTHPPNLPTHRVQ